MYNFKYEGRLEEGGTPGGDKEDREEPGGAKTEDGVGQAIEVIKKELQPPKRKEC